MIAVGMLAATCDATERNAQVSQLEARLAEHSANVDDVEVMAKKVGATWGEAERAYVDAGRVYQEAKRSFELAKQRNQDNVELYQDARVAWGEAERRWELYKTLVIIAAAIDAGNLDRARQEAGLTNGDSLDCGAKMSTASYRRLMFERGLSLTGMDIDHIVPQALGGADHPANYQVIPSGTNRSLGAAWDESKCMMPGAKRCAAAMAVSRHCGSFRGPSF